VGEDEVSRRIETAGKELIRELERQLRCDLSELEQEIAAEVGEFSLHIELSLKVLELGGGLLDIRAIIRRRLRIDLEYVIKQVNDIEDFIQSLIRIAIVEPWFAVGYAVTWLVGKVWEVLRKDPESQRRKAKHEANRQIKIMLHEYRRDIDANTTQMIKQSNRQSDLRLQQAYLSLEPSKSALSTLRNMVSEMRRLQVDVGTTFLRQVCDPKVQWAYIDAGLDRALIIGSFASDSSFSVVGNPMVFKTVSDWRAYLDLAQRKDGKSLTANVEDIFLRRCMAALESESLLTSVRRR
jgi:hypothetical protein